MSDMDRLGEAVEELAGQVGKLTTKVEVMSTHVDYLKTDLESRKKTWAGMFMLAAGAMISAFVAWLVGGGMANGK